MIRMKALHKEGFYCDVHSIDFGKQIIFCSVVEDYGAHIIPIHLRVFELLIIQEDNCHPVHIPLINKDDTNF